MLDERILTLARTACTERQARAFIWHHRGMSLRAIALRLDQTHSTVQDAYDGACRALRRAGVKFTPDGNPYLEDVA